MRLIPLWALRPGMKVARRVYDSKGFLLLNVGVTLEREYIQSLKRIGIRAIYVEDPLIPDVDIEDVILEETRQKALKLVRDMMSTIKEASEQNPTKFINFNREFSKVLDDIISQLLVNRNLTVNLADIRSTDDYTFAHSVNVAVLSLITAISMGLSKRDLINLGLGSFLHDLGKTLLPLSILNKAGSLTREEMLEMMKHPSNGYEMVRKQLFINGATAAIVQQHHERINGSGYPQGLTGDEIELYPKICAVADVYDALVSDRPYRPAYPPHKALELLEVENEGFDLTVLQHFYQHIAAYPIGTVVALNDGRVGVVVHNTVGYPTRPKVRVLWLAENFEPVEPAEVDLVEILSLVVDRVIPPEELPERAIQEKRD
jgi:HD-GYP domain-containing protein (c-di-GMP phosphodiesterase class II)